MLIGKSSDLYQELYKSGVMFSMPGVDYEFSRDYAHILVTGQSKEPEKVYESFKNTIRELSDLVYKVDTNGNKIYDEFNIDPHTLSAIWYALDDITVADVKERKVNNQGGSF